MAAYLGPIILVLIGLAGLIVVFGRHARDVRVTETPRAAGEGLRASGVTGRRAALFGRIRIGFRFLWRLCAAVLRWLARFLQRPPAVLRVPRIAFPRIRRTRRTEEIREERGGSRRRIRLFSRFRAARESLVKSSGAPEDRMPGGAPRDGRADSHVLSEPSARARELEDHRAADETPSEEFTQKILRAQSEQPQGIRETATVTPVAEDTAPPLPAGVPQERQMRGDEAGPSLVHTAPVGELPHGKVLSDTGEQLLQDQQDTRASLEFHVDERVAGKRKVVGRVRPALGPRRGQAKTAGGDDALRDADSLDSIEKLLNARAFDRAEQALMRHLSVNPRDLQAYRLLGRLYIDMQDFSQAREVLEETLHRDPKQPALFGLLGRVYFSLGQYGNALQMYQRAHDADETNLEYLEHLLAIASRMDRRPLVKVTAEKILLLDPQHAEAQKHLARVAAV